MAGSDELLPQEQVVFAFIQKIINACNGTAFESSALGILQKDWKSIKRSVLTGNTIMPQDGNTVLHEAAMKTNGGLDTVKILLEHAPFLICKTNLSGETVWHIAAREEYHTGRLFDVLENTRLIWKEIFEEYHDGGRTAECVNGVYGSLADLSVGTVNNNGNTALHEAVLSNNMIVARVLGASEAEENIRSALRALEPKGPVPCSSQSPARFSADNIPPEERVVAAVQKAIKAGQATAFRISIEKAFRTAWDELKGPVLHRITLPGGRTVLHYAAMTNGALKIVETICDRAPFLMCKPDESGETVWHIAARDKYVSKGLFDILYDTRQFWKKELEAADTTTLKFYGVEGAMDELSINAANIVGNTALHEALLCKNTPVAQKLFEADKDVCYRLNKKNKSPMNLALENGEGDAALFKSMFEYAAGTALGKSAIMELPC